MAVVAGLEQLNQYDVGVYVVGNHDEVVAAAGEDGEKTHVFGVEFFDGLYPDVKLFRICGGQLDGCCIGRRRFSWIARLCGIGGAYSLPLFLMWPCRFSMETGNQLDTLV